MNHITLSQERRLLIDALKEQAYANSVRFNPTQKEQCYGELHAEYLGLIELFEELSDVGAFLNFYENIESAFLLLLKDKPRDSEQTFKSFLQLTSLFRVIEANKPLIHTKIAEFRQLIQDMDAIEAEGLVYKD